MMGSSPTGRLPPPPDDDLPPDYRPRRGPLFPKPSSPAARKAKKAVERLKKQVAKENA